MPTCGAKLALLITFDLLKGSPRCGVHSDGIVDELSAKHSHLSSQSQFESESGDGDFDSIFSSQIFSMVLKWVAQASTFTVQPGVRSSRTRLAQRLALPLAPHFAQDIVISKRPKWKVQGSSDPYHFIFEINVGKSRIRPATRLKMNDASLDRLRID